MFIDKRLVVLCALSAFVVKKIQVLQQVYDFVHSLCKAAGKIKTHDWHGA